MNEKVKSDSGRGNGYAGYRGKRQGNVQKAAIKAGIEKLADRQ